MVVLGVGAVSYGRGTPEVLTNRCVQHPGLAGGAEQEQQIIVLAPVAHPRLLSPARLYVAFRTRKGVYNSCRCCTINM